MRIGQVVVTPAGVVGVSTSAAAQSKSVEMKNEDVISKGCVKFAVARCGELSPHTIAKLLEREKQ